MLLLIIFSLYLDDSSGSDLSEPTTSTSESNSRRSKRKEDEEWTPPKPKRARTCDECEITFPYEGLYKKHMKLAHPLPFKCGIRPCDETFATSEELNKHKEYYHTREKCPQCTRVMYKQYIPNHIERDHKESLCHLCGAVCKSVSQLNSHRRLVHKVDPIKCHCGKWYVILAMHLYNLSPY